MKNFALAALLAVGALSVTACSAQAPSVRTVTVAPFQADETAYLNVVEKSIDVNLGIPDAFSVRPEMKDSVLSLANSTCTALAHGASESTIIFVAVQNVPQADNRVIITDAIKAAEKYMCDPDA